MLQVLEFSDKIVLKRFIDIKTAPNLWYNKITPNQYHTKKGANLMIYQNTQTENTQNQFSNAIRELQLGKLLRRANITKTVELLLMKYSSFCCCWYFRERTYSGS